MVSCVAFIMFLCTSSSLIIDALFLPQVLDIAPTSALFLFLVATSDTREGSLLFFLIFFLLSVHACVAAAMLLLA